MNATPAKEKPHFEEQIVCPCGVVLTVGCYGAGAESWKTHRMRVQHGPNPEHSYTFGWPEGYKSWVDSLHAYQRGSRDE